MDYHLKPIGKTCAATGAELVPGSTCYSVLVEQDGEFVRVDYSPAGWSGPPEGIVGYWQCVVPHPVQNAAKPLDADALMRYFEQLGEDPNPAQEKFRYVLALLLLQKRRLKVDGSRQDGDVEYLQLTGCRGEGTFEVRDPQLADDEIQQIQQGLNAHLTSEWN
jgi:hypothetical protein